MTRTDANEFNHSNKQPLCPCCDFWILIVLIGLILLVVLVPAEVLDEHIPATDFALYAAVSSIIPLCFLLVSIITDNCCLGYNNMVLETLFDRMEQEIMGTFPH